MREPGRKDDELPWDRFNIHMGWLQIGIPQINVCAPKMAKRGPNKARDSVR